MKPLIAPRYDPLAWCGLCFLVATVGFWWPFFEANFGPDSADSRIGIVIVFTGPFVIAAAVRSAFAFRRFLVAREHQKPPVVLIAAAFALTTGAVIPALYLLFILLYACSSR